MNAIKEVVQQKYRPRRNAGSEWCEGRLWM